MEKRYMDVSLPPEIRAEALLSEMSLDEKMAQINCIFPFDKACQDYDRISEWTKHGIGEVSTLEMRRIETLEEAAAWQRRIQTIVMENSPHHIPAVFHMEGLCGAFIQDAVSFPAGIGRGAGFDPELEEKVAEIVSRQEAACGITQIFAPVLDISRDSRMGRQGETYGEDPTLAAALGAACTRGIQKNETAGRKTDSVAKHFLAFHNSQGGIHGTHSDTPPRLLREIYARPFQAAITESGLKGIMPCYCSVDGEPLSVSWRLLRDLLRGEMGFDGLCVSDYGGIGNSHTVQHIGETLEDVGLMSLEAGMDIELPSTSGYGEGLKQWFLEGKADITLLDEAVKRVLAAKFRMGLFEHPFALQGEELRNVFSNEKDHAVTLQSARESLVLLKNNGVLPLQRKGGLRIALIGPHAAFARKYFGGYTHLCMMESTYAIANSIAGVSGIEGSGPEEIITIPGTRIQSDETPEFDEILRRQKPGCKSLLQELKKRMPEAEIRYAYGYPAAGDDQSRFEEALELVRDADLVLLTIGGKHGTCSMATMGEGVDSSNINLPPCQDAFIRLAAELHKPMIGIHFDGRPVSSDAADRYLDALLEAWSPAEAGAQAVTDVLLGEYNPGGRLPVSVAYHAGQIPVYYNHPWGSAWHQGESIGFANYVDLPHKPRYDFGYGLSYTEFTYSNLRLSAEELSPEKTLQIRVNIENSGAAAGDEVVQLYLRDLYASMIRPVKELAGFKRITLQPGEKREITFFVEPGQLAFPDKDMRWKIEKGEFAAEIGSSSENIRLKASFRITEDRWVDGKKRSFYARAVSSDAFSGTPEE